MGWWGKKMMRKIREKNLDVKDMKIWRNVESNNGVNKNSKWWNRWTENNQHEMEYVWVCMRAHSIELWVEHSTLPKWIYKRYDRTTLRSWTDYNSICMWYFFSDFTWKRLTASLNSVHNNGSWIKWFNTRNWCAKTNFPF